MSILHHLHLSFKVDRIAGITPRLNNKDVTSGPVGDCVKCLRERVFAGTEDGLLKKEHWFVSV